MRKRIKMKQIIILFLLMFPLFVVSQNDKKAKELLDNFSTKIKSYDNVWVEFRYTVKNFTKDISQDNNGTLTIEKEKYISNFLGTTEIFDGKKKYTIIPEDREITIENYDSEKENMFSPSKIITFYTEGYHYKWDNLLYLSGKTIQFVKLKPIDKNSDIKEILIGVDNKTKNLHQIIQINKDGTRSELSVISFQTNKTLSNNHFTFVENNYPNYYINRLD